MYLEVEDDGPDEAHDDGWPSVHHVAGVNVDQLDLENERNYGAIVCSN